MRSNTSVSPSPWPPRPGVNAAVILAGESAAATKAQRAAAECRSVAAELLDDPDNLDLALRLHASSAEPRNAAVLFDLACRIRDEHVGRHFVPAGVISPIATCEVTPPCVYCPRTPGYLLTETQALAVLPMLAGHGLHWVYLNGGTLPGGYDAQALALVEAAVEAGLSPVLNFGPSFSRAGLRAMHRSGAAAIVASTEAFSPELFARLKPGEAPDARQVLMDDCEEEGIPFEAIAIVGVGERIEDHLDRLLRLRRYRCLRRVSFSRFRPAAGTPMADCMRCSPWAVARLVALARLILPPACEIGLNMGLEADELPLWFAAGGGGGRIHAVVASPRDDGHLPAGEGSRLAGPQGCVVVDRRPLLAGMLAEFGAGLAAVPPRMAA